MADHGVGLALRGLTKTYGSATARAGVDLDVRAGEFVTFLGPSGSGKTTTLNLVAGFLEPDAGEILLNGAPISRLPPHRRNVGMVFQNYALFPHMTAAENIAFPLKQRRVGKRDMRRMVQETLDL